MSNKPSVLVVDDESGILDTLRILLRNEGFEVTTAQGGKAGLEQIRAGTHDIVLSDVRMPQVSGLDILTAAREQDPMTPVILLTAQASLQSAIGVVNSGAFYYIQKPFSGGPASSARCGWRTSSSSRRSAAATRARSPGRSANRSGSWSCSSSPSTWRRPTRPC